MVIAPDPTSLAFATVPEVIFDPLKVVKSTLEFKTVEGNLATSIFPVKLADGIPPVPVISFPFKSKLPPN